MTFFGARPLTAKDENLTHEWRCDPDTRLSSVDRSEPTIDQHREWMAARLAGNREIYTSIVVRGVVPVGMFTLIRKGENVASLGYMVAPAFRGLGFAVGVRSMAIDCVQSIFPGVGILESKIRVENRRSLRVALKMGAILRDLTTDGFIILETIL